MDAGHACPCCAVKDIALTMPHYVRNAALKYAYSDRCGVALGVATRALAAVQNWTRRVPRSSLGGLLADRVT